MLMWWIRLSGAVGFGALGWWLSDAVVIEEGGAAGFLPWGLVITLAGVAIGAIITPYVTVLPLRKSANLFAAIPTPTLASGILGLLAGLLVAAVISIPLLRLEGWLGLALPLSLMALLGFVGAAMLARRESELFQLLPGQVQKERTGRLQGPRDGQLLMDTSAIIDGRIADITHTGFVSGTLLVPRFILDELRHIADSSDTLRRNRGRRGLEMLNKLRKESVVPIQVLDTDVRDGTEADSKLVKLAKSMNASIVTTDFNLNRVAELQGVRVLNVNELANALKPVVFPGEEMSIRIIQEGKEPGQGVAFLDDGTMVVVENGRRHINQHLDVTVTRMLQTPAGRIIFAQPKS